MSDISEMPVTPETPTTPVTIDTPVTLETTPDEIVLPAVWNFRQLLIAFFVTLVLQSVFLPCMCYEGLAKVQFGMMFDGFVLIRILIALVRKERGRDWLVYVILLYSSPLWITILISCLH